LQLSENSSLVSGDDTTSERVRFDDNVSFMDERGDDDVVVAKKTSHVVPEETDEELAQVISPKPERSGIQHAFYAADNVTTLSIGEAHAP
jgi:hypothetical protein